MVDNSTSDNSGQPRGQKMNKRFTYYFLVLFLVNIWVLFAIGLASTLAKYQWQEILGTEGQYLHVATRIAIRTGIIWPATFLLASLLGFILTIWSNLREYTLLNIFCVIVILELAIMAFHILCLLIPNMTIMYGLGT